MQITILRLITLLLCSLLFLWIVACNTNQKTTSVATIEYPLDGAVFAAEELIEFKATIEGEAIDSQDLLWEVILHHNSHKHLDEFAFKGLQGTWEFPDHGDNTYSELCLSTLVNTEKTNTNCVNLYHKEVSYTFDSVPSGLELSYNSSTYTTPFTGKESVQTLRISDQPSTITAFYNTPTPNSTAPQLDISQALESYAIGDTILLSGQAIDKEDGILASSTLHWTVTKHNSDNSQSTSFQKTGETLSWQIPNHSDDSYFEVCLRAHDSSDTLTRECLDIANKEIIYQFDSQPQGLTLSYENELYTTPFTIKGIENAQRTIFAPSPQNDYAFQSWSIDGSQDENTQNQQITLSTDKKLINATFVKTQQRLTQETYIEFEGFATPVTIEWTNGNRLFVSEKHGKIWVIQDGKLIKEPFADLSKESNHRGDRGILGLTLHPQFPDIPYVYTLYTYDPPEVYNYLGDDFAGPDGAGQRTVRLVRYTADPQHNFNKVLPNSAKVLVGQNGNWQTSGDPFSRGRDVADETTKWACYKDGQHIQDCIPQDDLAHASGSLMFAKDGSLLFSIGDGVDGDKSYDLALRTLDLNSFAGKLLRIDPKTGQGLNDNPFFNGNPDSTQSKVYNLGLRNPFRFTLHPETDEPYIADVGWEEWEEINRGIGQNFGWPCYEGSDEGSRKAASYNAKQQCQDLYQTDQASAPFYSWYHPIDKGGAAIIGPFYTGTSFPDKYQNGLFFGDYVEKKLWVLFSDNDNVRTEFFTDLPFPPTDIKLGPDGDLYIVDYLDQRIVKLFFETHNE